MVAVSRNFRQLFALGVLTTLRHAPYSGSMQTMTGKDLELRRRAMDVSTSDLARAAGYKAPSSITQIEQRARVPKRLEERYLTALGTFGTVPNIVIEEAA